MKSCSSSYSQAYQKSSISLRRGLTQIMFMLPLTSCYQWLVSRCSKSFNFEIQHFILDELDVVIHNHMHRQQVRKHQPQMSQIPIKFLEPQSSTSEKNDSRC
jgi:hypothetical protein